MFCFFFYNPVYFPMESDFYFLKGHLVRVVFKAAGERAPNARLCIVLAPRHTSKMFLFKKKQNKKTQNTKRPEIGHKSNPCVKLSTSHTEIQPIRPCHMPLQFYSVGSTAGRWRRNLVLCGAAVLRPHWCFCVGRSSADTVWGSFCFCSFSVP